MAISTPLVEAIEQADPRPSALRSIPPFPGVALQMLRLLESDDFSAAEAEELLLADPSLSARVLKTANSPLYGFRYEINTVSRAAVMLGSEALKKLILGVSLGGYARQFANNEPLQVCWKHCVASAIVAERLARLLGQPEGPAYTAGLLHDVGRLGLLAGYPEGWRSMLEVATRHGIDELKAERELFDIDHCAAGEYLAREWNLPEDLVTAIAEHSRTELSDASLVSIVAAAERLANLLGYDTLEVERDETISDVIAGLPLADQEGAASMIADLGSAIETTLAAMGAAS